jgi:hypothetical protein
MSREQLPNVSLAFYNVGDYRLKIQCEIMGDVLDVTAACLIWARSTGRNANGVSLGASAKKTSRCYGRIAHLLVKGGSDGDLHHFG